MHKFIYFFTLLALLIWCNKCWLDHSSTWMKAKCAVYLWPSQHLVLNGNRFEPWGQLSPKHHILEIQKPTEVRDVSRFTAAYDKRQGPKISRLEHIISIMCQLTSLALKNEWIKTPTLFYKVFDVSFLKTIENSFLVEMKPKVGSARLFVCLSSKNLFPLAPVCKYNKKSERSGLPYW